MQSPQVHPGRSREPQIPEAALKEAIALAQQEIEKMRAAVMEHCYYLRPKPEIFLIPNFHGVDIDSSDSRSVLNEVLTAHPEVGIHAGYIGRGQDVLALLAADILTFTINELDPNYYRLFPVTLFEAMSDPKIDADQQSFARRLSSFGEETAQLDPLWENWQSFTVEGRKLEIRYPDCESTVLQTHCAPFYGSITGKFGEMKGTPSFRLRNADFPQYEVSMNAEQISLLYDFFFLQGHYQQSGHWRESGFRTNPAQLIRVLTGRKEVSEISYAQLEALVNENA